MQFRNKDGKYSFEKAGAQHRNEVAYWTACPVAKKQKADQNLIQSAFGFY
jgi:hypothetical protein